MMAIYMGIQDTLAEYVYCHNMPMQTLQAKSSLIQHLLEPD